MVFWLHDRYYAVVAGLIAITGVLLVLDGDWSWSSQFVWLVSPRSSPAACSAAWC